MLVLCCNKDALFASVGRCLGGLRIVCTYVCTTKRNKSDLL